MNYRRKILTNVKGLCILMVTFITLIGFVNNAYGQAQDFNSPKSNPNLTKGNFDFDPDRLVFGGNLGASFGDITYVELAPTAGYLITDNYLFGLSARYVYFEDRTLAPAFIYKTNMYGGGIFNQYYILETVILHAEYELLNKYSHHKDKRLNVGSVLVGGGYRSNMGGNSFFSILLLYNLNETIESPYNTNPILRVGIGIGM